MRKLTILAAAALALAGCKTSSLTFDQSMYATMGAYRTALAGALDYARSPTADRAIVQRLNDANQSRPVRSAVRYGQAYVICGAEPAGKVGDIDCSLFDFSPATATTYLVTLRGLVLTLNTRN